MSALDARWPLAPRPRANVARFAAMTWRTWIYADVVLGAGVGSRLSHIGASDVARILSVLSAVAPDRFGVLP